MVSVKGYFDGKNYVTEEKIPVKKGRQVIITFLDEFNDTKRDLKKFVGKVSKSDSELIEKAVADKHFSFIKGISVENR